MNEPDLAQSKIKNVFNEKMMKLLAQVNTLTVSLILVEK